MKESLNNRDRKKQRSSASDVESVRAKWLCCAFKLGFVQLICKASIIFKPILKLALWNILKERELYKSKHVLVDFIARTLKCYHPAIKFTAENSKAKINFLDVPIMEKGNQLDCDLYVKPTDPH